MKQLLIVIGILTLGFNALSATLFTCDLRGETGTSIDMFELRTSSNANYPNTLTVIDRNGRSERAFAQELKDAFGDIIFSANVDSLQGAALFSVKRGSSTIRMKYNQIGGRMGSSSGRANVKILDNKRLMKPNCSWNNEAFMKSSHKNSALYRKTVSKKMSKINFQYEILAFNSAGAMVKTSDYKKRTIDFRANTAQLKRVCSNCAKIGK